MKHLLLLLAFMANAAFLLAMESADPTITCINGMSVNLDGSGSVTIWASDVLLYAEDDNTPANQLVFGLRVAGNGSGFPFDANGNPILNQTFECIHIGTIDLELWVMDADGNTSYCTTYVIVEDNFNNCPPVVDSINPTIVCLNGLSANVGPDGTITIWASDLLQYAEDNITPNQLLIFGMRQAGSGSGFPFDANGNPIENLVFNCENLGSNVVELWVIDQAGNSAYCTTSVIISDNFNTCPVNPASGTTESGAAVHRLRIAPNPASGSGILSLQGIAADVNWNLQISESSGRILRQDRGSGPDYDLSGKGLAPGLYFLRLLCDDGQTFVGKLTIR